MQLDQVQQTDTKSRDLYIDLLKKSLSFELWDEPPVPISRILHRRPPVRRFFLAGLQRLLHRYDYGLVHVIVPGKVQQEEGRIWPGLADTMIGRKRLDNLEACVRQAIENDVPGDLVETGVWRGGACILMRGILAAYGVSDKRIFVADSFQGLPEPDADRYPADRGDDLHTHEILAIGEEQVRANFERYGLLDDQVIFLKGWFEDTLPNAPIDRLCVLRLDGDMYSSTIEALDALYPKLSPGGFCIIDDYGDRSLTGCKQAVDDYRAKHGITEEIVPIDWTGRYWQKHDPTG